MENGKKAFYFRLLVVFLGLLTAVYLGYHIMNALRKDAELFTVRPYTARDSIVFTGYLFREETVLTARSSGLRRYHYYDGEKVASGKTVVSIHRFGGADTEAELASYKKQIEILRRSESLGRLTLDEVNIRIDRMTFRIAEKNAAGETAAASALSDELLVLMAKKDLLESGKEDHREEILLLENDLSRLLSALGLPSETVSSPSSGYFYSETDGYEGVFTSELAETLTLEEFDELISLAPQYASGAVGTLLTSAKWYYAAKTAEENAIGFTVGAQYDCLFIDNGYSETIPMKLHHKETANGETLLVFQSSSLPRDFDITRCQRMEAVRAEYKGLRIPAEVVRVEDGVTYVYILKEGAAVRREIDILWEQNGYFIVSERFESENEMPNLSLNDLILLDTEELYEGKFIH